MCYKYYIYNNTNLITIIILINIFLYNLFIKTH